MSGSGSRPCATAIGRASANIAVIAITALLIGLLLVPALALLRVTAAAAAHRHRALGAAAALAVVWVVLRVAGAPAASTGASALVVREVQSVQSGLRAHDILAREIPRDRFQHTPANQLLTGLRGKDVLLLFVESYGQVAVQNSSFSPGVDRILDQGTKQLNADGFSARTGYLSSSTFGGLSWLAHITTQSGIRIGTQRGYNQLAKSNRLTLATAFKRAGWRTVSEDPANKRHWKEGTSYYHYDQIYDRRNVGYKAPPSAYPRCPTNTSCTPSNNANSPNPTTDPSSPKSTSSQATPPGPKSRASSPGTTSATAASTTTPRSKNPPPPNSSATTPAPAPPTDTPSNTR